MTAKRRGKSGKHLGVEPHHGGLLPPRSIFLVLSVGLLTGRPLFLAPTKLEEEDLKGLAPDLVWGTSNKDLAVANDEEADEAGERIRGSRLSSVCEAVSQAASVHDRPGARPKNMFVCLWL